MNNIMLDLETLGTAPGCVVLSIGAVQFDVDRQELGETFYRVVSADDCRRRGLIEDQSTLAWWAEQSSEARAVLHQAYGDDNVNLDKALGDFGLYLDHFDEPVVWGNGADFDQPILQHCYRLLGIEPSWKFWNTRCYRTLKALMGVHVELPERQGVHHNALEDATYQARCAMVLLK